MGSGHGREGATEDEPGEPEDGASGGRRPAGSGLVRGERLAAPVPADAGDLLDGRLTARLEAWASESRVADAARRRERERWMRQAAEEGATLAGVLADLAEQGTRVTVRTPSGRLHRGRVRSLGADHLVLAAEGGDVVVALAALSSVRTAPGEPAPVGDRPVTGHRRLVDVLAGLAAEREQAAVVTRDGTESVAGTIRSVGGDILVVRPHGDRTTAYLPLDAVGEVILDARLATDLP